MGDIDNVPGRPAALNWRGLHELRAAQLAGIPAATLAAYYTSFEVSGSFYQTAAQAGSGAQTYINNDGGGVQITTGATANSDEILFNSSFMVSNLKTKRWYAAVRAKIETATDAAAQIDLVNGYQTSANQVCLKVTNGVLQLVATDGTPTTVTTSWTVDTTAKHDFAISFDLTAIRAYVDGVEVGSITDLTHIPAAAGEYASRVRNGATAAARTCTVYDAIFAVDAA